MGSETTMSTETTMSRAFRIIGDCNTKPDDNPVFTISEHLEKFEQHVREECAAIVRSMPQTTSGTDNISKSATSAAVLAGHTDPAPATDLNNNIDRLGGTE